MMSDDDETRRNIVNQLVGIVEEYASAELVTAMCGRGLNGWIDLSEQFACFDDFSTRPWNMSANEEGIPLLSRRSRRRSFALCKRKANALTRISSVHLNGPTYVKAPRERSRRLTRCPSTPANTALRCDVIDGTSAAASHSASTGSWLTTRLNTAPDESPPPGDYRFFGFSRSCRIGSLLHNSTAWPGPSK